MTFLLRKLLRVAGVGILILTSQGSLADDSVFLLQLGSFESEAEARARWTSLTTSYPELLEGLQVRLLDVTLPPDDFTVYRTQAGALTNRADAQIICEKLSEQGDECYVVETAMFSPEELERPLVAASQPANRQADQVPQPAQADTAFQQDMQAMEREMQSMQPPEQLMAEAPADAATPAVSQSVSAPASASARASDPLPGAGLKPLDGESEESFWSWLNPFSDDEKTEQNDLASETDSGSEQVQRQDRIEMNASYRPEMSVAAPVTAVRPSLLPPPPAPPVDRQLPPQATRFTAPVARSPESPESPVSLMRAIPQSQATRAPSAQSTASSMPSNLPFQIKRKGVYAPIRPDHLPEQTDFVPAGEEVQVAEAVRVPVTQVERTSPPPATVDQLRPLGMPSHAQRMHQLWAEIKFFDTQQEALAFWDDFRRANPSFPPVRVRITNPYVTPAASRPRVSLRVGPFEHNYLIQAVCEEVRGEDIRCHTVKDLGASTSAQQSRSSGAGARQAARYWRGEQAQEMYWVQLGGFESPIAAQAAWERLRQRHEPLLNDFMPNIQTSPQSSAMQTVYRLRTGPYLMRPSADNLCKHLKQFGTKCLTIFSP